MVGGILHCKIMKVQLNRSVKTIVEEIIKDYGVSNIKYIALKEIEYIQFLEEIGPTNNIILRLPERKYKGVQILLET